MPNFFLVRKFALFQMAGEILLIAGRHQLSTGPAKSSAALMAFHSRDDGSVAVEYGLIAAFLVVIIIVALVQLRTSLIELPLPTLNTAFEEAQP